MSRLRVATWNVHGLRAGVGPIAREVRAEALDILLVQESGPRRRLRALATALGMEVATDPFVFPRRRVKNAVLARRPLEVRSHRPVRFGGGSVLYPRGAMIAGLDELTAVSVHLGLREAERANHVRQLLELLSGIDEPIVVGGDLNAFPDGAAPARLTARYPDLWALIGEGAGATFPAPSPTARIDFLFAGPALRPLRVWTAGGAASDHLMVVADVALAD